MAELTEWRVIPSWPNYEVSLDGRVRCAVSRKGATKGQEIKPTLAKGGRRQYCLWNQQKSYRTNASRLIYEAFIGPIPHGLHICHNDGNHHNDSLDNLRPDTNAGNMADVAKHGVQKGGRNPMSKLTDEDVLAIRAARGVRIHTDLAKQYGISASAVSSIQTGRLWPHLPGAVKPWHN